MEIDHCWGWDVFVKVSGRFIFSFLFFYWGYIAWRTEIHVSWKWKICPYFIHNAQTKIHSTSQWWNLCIKGDDCTSWSTHSIVSLQCAHDSSCHEMHQFEIDLDHCLSFFIYIGQTLQLISICNHPNKWIRIRIDTCFKTPKIGNFPV